MLPPQNSATIYICFNLNEHNTSILQQTHEIQISLIDHPSSKIPRCNSASNREPVLTSYISLKIDKNGSFYSFKLTFPQLLM